MSVCQSVSTEVKAVNLIDYLECQVCLDFAVGPIYSCKNGHVICGFCKPKIEQCPTCEDKDVTVMWILERILKSEGVKFPCRNKDHGCTMMIEPHQMMLHLEAQCDFRPIKCEESNPFCRYQSYAPNHLVQHWKEDHKVELMERDSSTGAQDVAVFNRIADLPEDIYLRCVENGHGRIYWPSCFFNFENHTFLCHVGSPGDNIFTWITLMGHEALANNYQYSVVFTSKYSKFTTKQIRFDKIPVHCLQYCDLLKIKDSGHAATLSYSALKLLHDKKPTDPQEKFSWNIRIEVSRCEEIESGEEK